MAHLLSRRKLRKRSFDPIDRVLQTMAEVKLNDFEVERLFITNSEPIQKKPEPSPTIREITDRNLEEDEEDDAELLIEYWEYTEAVILDFRLQMS
jgi:hypothetical protein